VGHAAPALPGAAEAFVHGHRERAREHFAEALELALAMLDPFVGELPKRDDLFVTTNRSSPASVQQFIIRTQPFWARPPEAWTCCTRIAVDRDVRRATVELHRRWTGHARLGTPRSPRRSAAWNGRFATRCVRSLINSNEPIP
jgi:hypothetical protein